MNENVIRFQKYFDRELPKQPTVTEAFNAANQKFKSETGNKGYSSYNSYSVVIKREN